MSIDTRHANDTASQPSRANTNINRPIFGSDAPPRPDPQDPVERVLARLEGVRRSGDGWSARCPAHDDRHASLSIGRGQGDEALIHCHALCDTEAVAAAIGLTVRDLFKREKDASSRRVVAEYEYRDANGDLAYVVVRFDPKDFRPKRPDGRGGWTWSLRGVTRLPYRLPELLAADPDQIVFVTEGEKDVDTLLRHGLVATTNPFGAGKWETSYSDWLRDRDVVVLPDNDDVGRTHRDVVVASLRGVARRVRGLELPGLPDHGDVTDWIGLGGSVETLLQLVAGAPDAWAAGGGPRSGAPTGPGTPPPGAPPTGPAAPPRPPRGATGSLVGGWPDPIEDDAFHGLAGRFARAVAPHSEADLAAILMQLLATAGCLVGDAVHAFAGDAEHPARINVITVGPTGRGRKDTAGRPSRRLAVRADPSFESRIVEGLSSGEGLIHAVRDPSVRLAGHGGGGSRAAVQDPGVEDKRLLVRESEFAQTLWVSRRPGNVLSPVIRKAWESGDLRTLTKNNPTVATGAHIVITGNITRDELVRSLDRTEVASGLVNRFLLCAARRSRLLPDGGGTPDAVLERLAEELAEVRVWASTRRRLQRDADASAIWHEVYPQLTQGEPGLYGAAINRAEAQTLRLSVLYAILDRSECIRAEHLRAALAVWGYAARSARWVFGDAVGDPVADRILAALRQKTPMSRTDISDLLGRHVPSGRIDIALANLDQLGHVRVVRDTDTGGRHKDVWHVV